MGCCQHENKQTEEKAAGGCCGGHAHAHTHGHGHDHGAVKSEGSCCKGGAISGFFKKLFGGKKSGCCQ